MKPGLYFNESNGQSFELFFYIRENISLLMEDALGDVYEFPDPPLKSLESFKKPEIVYIGEV